MMTMHKLTAGDGYLYLIRQVAASDSTHRGRPSLDDYYSSKGETPGRWMGRGLDSLGQPQGRDLNDDSVQELWSVVEGSHVSEAQMKALFGEGLHPNAEKISAYLVDRGEVVSNSAVQLGRRFAIHSGRNEFKTRLCEAYADFNRAIGRDAFAPIAESKRASIRSTVAAEMFVEQYGRDPADAREFSGFVASQSRPATTAVAGYDLTFTPVKSISIAWATAPRPLARAIERAHQRSVQHVIAMLEQHAAFSRMGAGGVAQVETTGLIIAGFEHRDSRSGDPNPHTHIVVSNKVCVTGADGIPRWLALDGKAMFQMNVAASEAYNTAMEAELMKLGFRFLAAARGAGKGCVREIAGIPQELITRFSTRRRSIEQRAGELAKVFQNSHGREPTTVEFIALKQQANLETRAPKHEPRSLGEQRQMWRTQAAEILGGAHEVDAMIASASSHIAVAQPELDRQAVDQIAATVIAAVSASRSTWRPHHVRAEAERQLRSANRADDRGAIERIVSAALERHSVVLSGQRDAEKGEPTALRRRVDGASVYTRHGETDYSSPAVLAAERRILDAAALDDGLVADDTSVELALLEADVTSRSLNDGQRALVREMATSGARVQLALAPAGTGKTTAMATLAAAWRNSGGSVVGMAPTAAAAEVLAADLGAATDTLAKLVVLANPTSAPTAVSEDPARVWFDAIDSQSLLIVDEAGKASTAELDAVIGLALARGASVRLVGDDHQLSSVSAGGVLRDLAADHRALTLSEVVRFGDTQRGRAEGAASLALRRGDPAGIAFYLDHGRVHVGADALAAEQAYTAWLADRGAGRDSILLAPTNDLVAELNDRARADRLRSDGTPPGRTVELGDGLLASAGDWITTRSNARWLPIGKRGWVKNGQRWMIHAVERDGALTVRPLLSDGMTTVRLPASYVREHTTLGYASTIDISQGITADTCHVVGSDQLSRQQIYVALTRGRHENHLYFSTAEADPHRILTPKATHPPTAVDILAAILRRDEAQQSAHSVMRDAADSAVRLGPASAMYLDALGAAAEHCAGSVTMARIDSAAKQVNSSLDQCEAWPVLRRHLALLAGEGIDPAAALHEAAAHGGLAEARDAAALLDWRLPIASSTRPGPLHWLDPIPTALAEDRTWGAYLGVRAQLVSDLAAEVRAAVATWTAADIPVWGRPLIDHPKVLAEVAVFRAAHGVDPADTRITGPQQHRRRSAEVQRAIQERSEHVVSVEKSDIRRWQRIVETFDLRVTRDPYWPQLATRIDEIARSGADLNSMLRHAMNAGGPLPDELPAAALWWRLSGSDSAADSIEQDVMEDRGASDTRLDPERAKRYRIDDDLEALREEVGIIDTAGSLSPATCYDSGITEAVGGSVSAAVASIAESDMAVQPVSTYDTNNKHALLRGVALAALRGGYKVLALAATPEAMDFAVAHRYRHSTAPALEGLPKLQSGEWRPEPGSLIIVDDADHLSVEQLNWLTTNAGKTNTKLVLSVSHDATPGQSRHLVDALLTHLPWAAPHVPVSERESTAIVRVTAHLGTIEQISTESERSAADSLAHLEKRIAAYRELLAPLRFARRSAEDLQRDEGLSL